MTAINSPIPARPDPIHPAPVERPFFSSNMPFARFGLIVNGPVPLAILIWDAYHHDLGVNAVNFAIHTTGLIALIFLVLSLCVTPVRSITGAAWLVQFRRWLGLYGFYYACCHFIIYFWWDRSRSVSSTVHEITHRLYLVLGTIALLLLLPLAATSTNFMIRKMGGKNWKRLHRLAYLAAALACVHYYIEVKADTRQPTAFVVVLGVMLGYRGVAFFVHRKAGSAKPLAAGRVRFWKGELRVGGMFRETENVRTFRLVYDDGGEIPFAFAAGQFLNLSVEIERKKVGRSYTIASPPTRAGYIELTIKREANGHVSKFLHDMYMTGQSVAVSGPAGRFTFSGKDADRVLLIAGGVGVTPVMAILRDLTDRCWPGAIDLIFVVRTEADIIFADELKFLAARHENVNVHISITRDVPAEWNGLRGRISAELLKSTVPDLAQRDCFICGPNEMAAAAKAELITAGVEEKRIKVESFTPAAAVKMDDGKSAADAMAVDSGVRVTFAKSDQSAPLPASETILEAAESAGVEMDFDCRSGICGRCRVKLLAGAVTMQVQDALTDADISENFILACQAHATADVTVDA